MAKRRIDFRLLLVFLIATTVGLIVLYVNHSNGELIVCFHEDVYHSIKHQYTYLYKDDLIIGHDVFRQDYDNANR